MCMFVIGAVTLIYVQEVIVGVYLFQTLRLKYSDHQSLCNIYQI